MEAPFKIGQKVVCINNLPLPSRTNNDATKDLETDKVYTVLELGGIDERSVVFLYSVMVDNGKKQFYCSSRFAPLPEQRERINYVAVSETLRETAVETFITQTN